jgi:hypothetical protein
MRQGSPESRFSGIRRSFASSDSRFGQPCLREQNVTNRGPVIPVGRMEQDCSIACDLGNLDFLEENVIEHKDFSCIFVFLI